MQNPYANKNKLPHDSPMFFGRGAEIRNIRASLSKEYPRICFRYRRAEKLILKKAVDKAPEKSKLYK